MTHDIIRVLCVDDHAFLADGLKARFARERDIQFVGHLPTADGLADEVQRLKPSVILLDIEMPGSDPFDAADDVRRRCEHVRVVFLSAYVRDIYISAAFNAGAWGYFSKSDDPDDIVNGIRRVHRGQFAFGPKVEARCQPRNPARRAEPATPASRLELLTERECEILRLIGRGMSRTEIADVLHRSPKTIDGHRERLMTKLDIHTGPGLIRFAIREGLVEA